METLLKNKAKCLECHMEVESFVDGVNKSCKCGNVIVNGGKFCRMRTVRNLKKYKDTSKYCDKCIECIKKLNYGEEVVCPGCDKKIYWYLNEDI